MTSRANPSRREGGVAVLSPGPGTGAAAPSAVEAFAGAVEEALADEDCRALVLDLPMDPPWELGEVEPAALMAHARSVASAGERLRCGGKPSIAAVRGKLCAAGIDLALSCHVLFASEDSTLSLGPTSSGFGGLARLPRRLGAHRSIWLALRSEAVPAAELVTLGLAERVLPTRRCFPEALAWARCCGEHDPAVVRALLEGLAAGADLPLDDALELEAQLAGLTAARGRRS